MGSKRNENLIAELRTVGIAEDLIAYLIDQRPSILLSTWSDIRILVLMVFAFGVGFFVWLYLSNISEMVALEHAQAVDAIFYADFYGFSMLAALFAWILIAGVLAANPAFVSQRVMASAFADNVIRDKNRNYLWKKAYINVDKTVPHDEQVRRIYAAQGAWGRKPGIVLLVIALLGFSYEVRVYTLYTDEGVIERSSYGFGDWETLSWSEATTVELGCNHVTGRDGSDDPIYQIHFGDETSRRLEGAIPLEGSWIDNILIIDVILEREGVQFKRWEWLYRDPMHPACLEKNRQTRSPEDYQKLLKLLRVTPEELSRL